MNKLRTERDGEILVVSLNRPEIRNAVDEETAAGLYEEFRRFDADDGLKVAVLCGEGEHFCAGADLKEIAQGRTLEPEGRGPMGPTRELLSKPVIAAVEGYAVAGGLELALWADLRVASETAIFGVFCRRWGVPLVDGGNVRLPRLVGQSVALDMILTGRPVGAEEALRIGLLSALVRAAELDTFIAQLAQHLLTGGAAAHARIKDLVRDVAGRPVDEALKSDTARRIAEIRASPEGREGIASFLEKRKPKWLSGKS
jgi:enoyl-CoA hydratase